MDICVERAVDFIVVSGDLFDSNIPDMALANAAVKKIREITERDISFYVVYGSHDFSPTQTSIVDLIESAGLVDQPISWMGKDWIMMSLIIVSVWQFFPFVVIGVLNAVASAGSDGGFSAGAMMPETDDMLFVPFAMMDTLFKPSNEVLLTLVKTADGTDVQVVADRVEASLKDAGYGNVSSVTYNDISKQIGTVMGAVSGFLAGIAGISLLVGGVGVMNTMYTSVLERTREIGVMKAVGATNGHVLAIFLIESGLMGLVGGAVGVVLGLLLSGVAGVIIRTAFNVKFVSVVSPVLIVGTLLFSFLIGAVAGLLPARRAAKLPPVDALRYE